MSGAFVRRSSYQKIDVSFPCSVLLLIINFIITVPKTTLTMMKFIVNSRTDT